MNILCDKSGLISDAHLANLEIYSHEPEDDDAMPEQLFENGSFVAAVRATTKSIPILSNASPTLVLKMWYIRIQSLLILQLGPQAAEEIMHNLGPLDTDEFTTSYLKSPEARLYSWKLRLLLVPVKSKGINQSAIQQYYSMGFEARIEASITDGDMKIQWLTCLKHAGLYALSVLVALRDYATAINFLQNHYEATKDSHMAKMLALLHLMIGDTLGCQAWCLNIKNPKMENEINFLRKFADDEMSITGLSELYQGLIGDSISQLETKILNYGTTNGTSDRVGISNLFVLYDLCYPNSKLYRISFVSKLTNTSDREPGNEDSL